MKKILPVLLLIVLLVSACNFPEERDISEDTVVQTRVAVLLTQGAPESQVPFNIVAPIDKDIDSADSEEPTPVEEAETETPGETSVTPEPTEEITEPTLEPTEEVVEPTPEPTDEIIEPTPKPTDEVIEPTPEETEMAPTPTPVETDPDKPWSGTPEFVEEFDSTAYWNFENNHLLSKASDGQLEFTSKGTPWWSSWYTTNPAQKNGYFETTFTMPNCNGSDRFGLVIRWIHPNVFYYLGVTCDGTWGFSLYNQVNQTIDLVTYTENDALNPVSESNRIGILATDNSFDFYINGTLVGSATHDGIQKAGPFGFVSMSTGTKDFKTLIDKLEYWAK